MDQFPEANLNEADLLPTSRSWPRGMFLDQVHCRSVDGAIRELSWWSFVPLCLMLTACSRSIIASPSSIIVAPPCTPRAKMLMDDLKVASAH